MAVCRVDQSNMPERRSLRLHGTALDSEHLEFGLGTMLVPGFVVFQGGSFSLR